MLRTLIIGLTVLVGAVGVGESHSSTDARPAFRVERIGLQEGLSQAQVTDIIQDRQGFLWIATQEGLNRFDGYEIKPYYHSRSDPKSLPEDWVTSLLLTRNGDLLVGTNESGIATFDFGSDSFTPLDLSNGNSVSSKIRARSMLQTSDGLVWIGTIDDGLYVYDHDARYTRRFAAIPSRDLDLRENAIIALTEGRNGIVWVGLDGGGLLRFEPATESFERFDLPGIGIDWHSASIFSLTIDDRDQLWIGTYASGLIRVSSDRKSANVFTHESGSRSSLGSNLVRDVLADESGVMWVATEGGLSQVDAAGTVVNYAHDPLNPSSLSGNRIRSLFRDNAGSLWIGSYSGLNKWNRASDAFGYWDRQELNSNLVTAVVEGNGGQVWVGTYGAGITLVSSTGVQLGHWQHDADDRSSLSDNRVMALHLDASNNLWAGARGGGLNLLANGSSEFIHYRASKQPGALSNDDVTAIVGDPSGAIWVGTYKGGVNRLVDGSFETFRHDPEDPRSIGDNRVVHLSVDRAGTLWLGTEGGGISHFDAATAEFTTIRAGDGENDLASDVAWEILEAADGALWVGTQGGGLHRWSPEDRELGVQRFERFSKQSGLPSDTIMGLAEDQAGNLWISSNKGLTQFNPTTRLVRGFDSSNGLRSDEFHQGVTSSTSGMIRFGGPAGLVSFDPTAVAKNEHIPEVVITTKVSGKPDLHSHSDAASLETILEYPITGVSFDFVGLDFVSPEKNQYRYRLIGFDEDWVEPERYRRAIYTNLDAGEYRFEVNASNNDGIWNSKGASVVLRVVPAPWLSNGAKVLYVMLGVLLIGFVVFAQKRKLRSAKVYQDALEKQVHDRTSELKSRNEELKLLNVRLKEASLSDTLTQLHNRRYFYEVIEHEVATIDRLNRGAGPSDRDTLLYFMMIDIDGFKSVNDRLGHKAGDEVLQQLAAILTGTVRQADTVIRWGGDEFLILGCVRDTNDIEVLAERIRHQVEEFDFEPDPTAISISTSIGLTCYPQRIDPMGTLSWERILEIADQAAYLAKSSGKNAWIRVDLQGLDHSLVAGEFPVDVLVNRHGLRVSSSRPIRPRPTPVAL